MRLTCLTLLSALTLTSYAPAADIIAQWNFNSVPPDTSTTTGSADPSVGTGTIAVVGGSTHIYSSGNNSTDPAATDDTAYHTRAYPAQGASNKTAGIQVNVSTAVYESIVVSWDTQHSASASRYFRFQYSVDGENFIDHDVLVNDQPLAFINGRTVNLNSITGANGNPNFAFRLVSEFESTATGSGTAGYVATSPTASYAASGTVRFDMLTVSGSVPDGNTFPTISAISNQTIRVDTITDALPFQIGDVETPADELSVSGVSSNPTIVPPEGIVFGGSGSNRTVTVGPNFDQIGTVTITVTVMDAGGKTASTSFQLTITPNNTAPTISAFTNVHTLRNAPFAPIDFTVSDAEQSADSLVVTATSSDQTIIADIDLVVGSSGGDRTLGITPVAGALGTVAITVTVTDNENLTAFRTFNAMVVRSGGIIFDEPFNYTAGPLTTASGRLWTTRAGSPNQMQVGGGVAQLSSLQTEDTMARLIGGPYDVSGSAVLYASFDLALSVLPDPDPDIFAHFFGVSVNDLRGRVLVSTVNAAAGFYRLGVANTTSTPTNVVDYPLDLSPATSYQVVLAYDVANGSAKLWINPASGAGPVDAIDPHIPIAINSFGLRQSGGIGDLTMDNLLIGTSFEAVTPYLTRVRIRRNGDDLEVYWPSAGVWEGFFLESTTSLANPDWQFVNEPSITVGDWDVVTIANPTGDVFFRLAKP